MQKKKIDRPLLEEILKHVEKPARYTGGEWNEIRKNPQKVKTKVALIFPDIYEIGMSYLGQKILYSILNDHPSILAERVFAPWTDFEQWLRSQNVPLFSLENKIPLDQFDVLGFSLLYELNYSNILTILELGRIPFFSSERTLDFPLAMAGGPAAFNPEPVAEIFDLFLVGDGEEAFVEIVENYRALKESSNDKSWILKELSKIKGVYVPSLYTTYLPPKSHLLAVEPVNGAAAQIQKRILFPFHRTPFPEKIVVPNIQVVFDRVAVEAARGCPQKCRFCQATSIYLPHRIKSASFVTQKMLKSLRSTGYEDASLSSLSISDYPYLEQVVKFLMGELEKEKISLSLSSLRPIGLSSAVVQSIVKVRKTGFTLVPEAGTERLRRVINKHLKDQEIWDAVAHVFSHGWRLIKLYFMVGLPTEQKEDLDGILELVHKIIEIGRRLISSPPRINLSLSSFIPKPHTPFQWLAMEEEKILEEKQKIIRAGLRKYRSVEIKEHPVKKSILEAIFSRGDRKLSRVVWRAWKNGARFDSWKDQFKFSFWEEAFRAEKIDYHSYLCALDEETILPWDHILTGVKKPHLLQELRKALQAVPSPSCFENTCSQCQGCDSGLLLEKRFREKITIKTKLASFWGEKTQNILRYRVFYSKLRQARYYSHLDLINIIKRAFRRAAISVIQSKGFHPKMMMSFVPALALGMGAKEEAFEFKSQYLFPEKEFLCRMNRYLPSGIKFLAMSKIKDSDASLNESLEKMVYSVDLKSKEIEQAILSIKHQRNLPFATKNKIVQTLINEFLTRNDESIETLFLDQNKGKLFIHLKHSSQKPIRAPGIAEAVFGIKNSVYSLTREKLVFKEGNQKIDR
jgi:radical SAM family uncharacterized protein/radical SAM-linked protein